MVILDRDANKTLAIVAETASASRPAIFIETDVADEMSVRHAIDTVAKRFGRMDSLLLCAGISGPVGQNLAQIASADWDRVMAVNVRGVFLCAKYALPLLSRSTLATIVLLASDSALFASAGMTPYCASKAAALMCAKGLCVDHPAIRVNSVCPSVVDTPMSRRDLGIGTGSFESLHIPVITADDVARHVLFYASDVSAPANGTTAVLDFGYAVRSSFPPIHFV